MSILSMTKAIPTTSSVGSGAYGTLTNVNETDIIITGSGTNREVKINLYGAEMLSGEAKNSIIKIPIPKGKTSQNTANSDKQTTNLINLQRIEENFILKGYLEDGLTYTAWQKLWMIRAMVIAGNVGAEGSNMKEVIFAGLTFDSTTLPLFLERIMWKVDRATKSIEETYTNLEGVNNVECARIEIELNFTVGNER